MANLSYLKDAIPNKVVALSQAPQLPRFYLLGDLPGAMAFLLPRYSESERDNSGTLHPIGFLIYNTTQARIEQHLYSGKWQEFVIESAVNPGTGIQLPPGGAIGQALVKAGQNSLDWKSIIDLPHLAKDDLLIGDSHGMVTTLGKGPIDTVLTSSASGLKWDPKTTGSNPDFDELGDIVRITRVSNDYLLTLKDFTVLVDCTHNPVTIFCPLQKPTPGQIFTIKRMDDSGKDLFIDGNGNMIDDSRVIEISDQWDAVTIQWIGDAWIQI